MTQALLHACACAPVQLTGAKEPAALERLVKTVGVKPEAVNRCATTSVLCPWVAPQASRHHGASRGNNLSLCPAPLRRASGT